MLSDWEVSDLIREKIKEGSDWYRERFEPLTEAEAHSYRVKATAQQGPRYVDGQEVKPPWPDYVGLHPHEIVERLKDSDADTVRQAKDYEKAGYNRPDIVDFVHPRDREPFSGYDTMEVRGILEKFSLLPDSAVAEAVAYEKEHKNRPAIVEYDKGVYEGQTPQPSGASA